MSKAKETQYYTVPEAARALDVSPSTVWRWIKAEKLSAYRVGPKNIRIKKEDLKTVIRPIRATGQEVINAIWEGYDPERVREALTRVAGSWADLDAASLITDLYRAREEGSRPAERP